MIILSLSQTEEMVWAAGPEGLFSVNGSTEPVAQPQQELWCCATADDRVLVGGRPHGVAFSLDDGTNWQASWMDGVEEPVVCIAPDPRVAETGVLLAGSSGSGILRTHNRGRFWTVCNFGLQDYSVLAITWAPLAPVDAWPQWEVVFAATEEGIYRSPNAGLGWRRSEGPAHILDAVFQALAVSPHFHQDGLVLAGTEETGLWRSEDGGRTFHVIDEAPERIDALTTTQDGWLLSDGEQLWTSTDSLRWSRLPESKPALVLLNSPKGVWAGSEEGVDLIVNGEL